MSSLPGSRSAPSRLIGIFNIFNIFIRGVMTSYLQGFGQNVQQIELAGGVTQTEEDRSQQSSSVLLTLARK